MPVKPEKASNKAFQGLVKAMTVAETFDRDARWCAISRIGSAPSTGTSNHPSAATTIPWCSRGSSARRQAR